MKIKAKLNKRERRAQALLDHYAACERLAAAVGMPAERIDGKKISVALLKLERVAHAGATALCNGEDFRHDYGIGNAHTSGSVTVFYRFHSDEDAWEKFSGFIRDRIALIFGGVPPGFFVNGDARGYALKIDDDDPAGKALIDAARMHTDWGGYGILSPEIE